MRIRITATVGFVLLGIHILMGLLIPRVLALAVEEDIDLVVTPAQPPSVKEPNQKVSYRAHIIEVKRGQFVKTEAIVSNEGTARSGPFEVGIYLSHDPDGRKKVHEFDIIKNIDLSGLEQISMKEEYLIPYSILPARDYWVVMEVDYDREVTEKDEKNKKVIQMINVPCDEFDSDYLTEYICLKPGEND